MKERSENMNKISRKIDSYLLLLLLEIFIVVSIFIIYKSNEDRTLDFIMLCVTFFVTMITYVGGTIVGLIISSISIFLYASYIFYTNLTSGIEVNILAYIWMISIPTLSFTCGKLQSYIIALQEVNRKLSEDYEDLVTIDQETGLSNIKTFYYDLNREMSKSKRHNIPCTLMLIKLPYYKDITRIIGEKRTNKLIKDISDLIINSTRVEDERYTLQNDTLAIIMSATDFAGATIVKNRIKDGLLKLNTKLKEEKKSISIEVKISIVQYDEKIKSALEFKTIAEEELQYDV